MGGRNEKWEDSQCVVLPFLISPSEFGLRQKSGDAFFGWRMRREQTHQ